MAITVSKLSVVADGTDQASGGTYSSSTVTPVADQVILVGIMNTVYTGNASDMATVTGNGITYTKIASLNYGPGALKAHMGVYRGASSSPTAGPIVATTADVLTKSCDIHVIQTGGADTSGSNGSGAIVQSVTNSTDGGNPSILTVTMASLSDANNATIAFFGNDGATTAVPGTGYTLIANTSAAQDDGLESQYKVPGTNNPSCQADAFVDQGAVALEIKVGSSSSTTTIAPTEGIQVYGGSTASLSFSLAVLSGNIVYSGNNPLLTNQFLPSSGSIVYSGNAPSVVNAIVVSPSDGVITYNGNVPDLSFSLSPIEGQIIFNGNIPSITGSGSGNLHYSRRHGRCYYS